MRRWLLLLTFILLSPLSASSQGGNTAITGVVLDPYGNKYTNSEVRISFFDPGTSGKLPLLNGSTFQTNYTGFGTDSFGNLPPISLPDNGLIAASSGATGTQWIFSICFSDRATCFSSKFTINCSANLPTTCNSNSINMTGPIQAVSAPLPVQVIAQQFTCPNLIASTTWTCNHNFNDAFAITQVVDLTGTVIYPKNVQNTTLNTTVITFTVAQAGTARIISTSSATVMLTFGGNNIWTGANTFKNINGIRFIDPANAAGWPGSDFGAWINAAAADVVRGEIYVAAGLYTWTTPIVLDGLTDIRIKGAGGFTGGGTGATQVTYTGTTLPISAKSSTGVEIGWIQFLWNNAALTGDFLNSSHSSSSDTIRLWIHDCSFFKTGAGVNLTNILNLDKTIVSEIGPGNNFNNANVAILGANANGSYANVIHVHDNHFSSSTGTIVQAMIRDLQSGSEINANTFEMGAAVGSPFVFDSNVQASAQGMDFHGNWIGDVSSTYNGTLFNLVGNGAGTGATGWSIRGNLIGGNSAATVTFFNMTATTEGVEISGNAILADGATNLAVMNATQGVRITGNYISSGTPIVTGLTFIGSVQSFEFTGNGWNGTPTTFLSGTPTSGVIYSASGNSPTFYGNYRTLAGIITFPTGIIVASAGSRATLQIADQGTPCTNGELALSAGWQSTGSATVTAVAGNGQTCSWTITTGTTTAANPTITDTLTIGLPNSGTTCWMNIYGGTHTAVAGEALRQTTFSASAPVFTANFTPTAAGTTYFVTRGCGP